MDKEQLIEHLETELSIALEDWWRCESRYRGIRQPPLMGREDVNHNLYSGVVWGLCRALYKEKGYMFWQSYYDKVVKDFVSARTK